MISFYFDQIRFIDKEVYNHENMLILHTMNLHAAQVRQSQASQSHTERIELEQHYIHFNSDTILWRLDM